MGRRATKHHTSPSLPRSLSQERTSPAPGSSSSTTDPSQYSDNHTSYSTPSSYSSDVPTDYYDGSSSVEEEPSAVAGSWTYTYGARFERSRWRESSEEVEEQRERSSRECRQPSEEPQPLVLYTQFNISTPAYPRQPGTYSRDLGCWPNGHIVAAPFFTPDPSRALLPAFIPLSFKNRDPQLASRLMRFPNEVLSMIARAAAAEDGSIKTLKACALTCFGLYDIFTAAIHYDVNFGGKHWADNLHKFMALRHARIAGPFRTSRRTAVYTFAPRGQASLEMDLFHVIEDEASVKSITFDMARLSTDAGGDTAAERSFEVCPVGDLMRGRECGYPNLVHLALPPGPLCTQGDMPGPSCTQDGMAIIGATFPIVPDAFKNLEELEIGDTAHIPSDGLAILLLTIFSTITKRIKLRLVFSIANANCPMVREVLAYLWSRFIASKLAHLEFSYNAPPVLLDFLPDAQHLRTLSFEDELHDEHLTQVFATPNLEVLTLSPFGFRRDLPAHQADATLSAIARALPGRTSPNLRTIYFESSNFRDGEPMDVADGPGFQELEAVCGAEGIELIARLP